MTVLLYELAACPLTNSVINSLDFLVNCCSLKLSTTTDINIKNIVNVTFHLSYLEPHVAKSFSSDIDCAASFVNFRDNIFLS